VKVPTATSTVAVVWAAAAFEMDPDGTSQLYPIAVV
jgi:hypothetical protein